MRFRTLALILVALLLTPLARPGSAAQPITTVYFPFVVASTPRPLLGLEVAGGGDPAWVGRAATAAPGWLRLNGLAWRAVEPTPDAGYSWSAPATQALEAQLTRAAVLGLRVVLVLHGSPTWAVAPYTADCAPIDRQHHARFARFAAAAVARYSAPPFNVLHFEIGNEPDAYIFGNDSPYGCWGRTDQDLYGGQGYGELLKAAYPAIKAANPHAQVLNGGLLLDAAYNPSTGSGQSARFLEGVLEAGAGASFDILAFHSYSNYDGTPDGHVGAQDWKPGYLRGLLARYGLSKPLFNTESALLCGQASPACALAQAHAIPRMYVRGLRDQLIGQIWYLYDNDGFRNTALVEPADPTVARPAALAFAQANRALAGMAYQGALAGLPAGAEGHRLSGQGRTTLVLWSATEQRVALAVAASAEVSCAAWDGAALPCGPSGGALTLSLGPGPVYVTLRQP